MADYTFMSWNIEHFGSGGERSSTNGDASFRRFRGKGCVNLCNFIASVMKNVEVDVLAVMELAKNKESVTMKNLQAALQQQIPDGDWRYDWIPSALNKDNAAGYFTASNNESYGVVWDNNKISLTRDSANRSKFKYLDLVTTGRNAPDGGGIDLNNLPPIVSADHPVDISEINIDLDFATSKGNTKFGSRRPMYFTMQAGPDQIRTVVYHAPYDTNNRTERGGLGSSRGTIHCSMSQQMYDLSYGIVAGDFNEDICAYQLDDRNPYYFFSPATCPNTLADLRLNARYTFFRSRFDLGTLPPRPIGPGQLAAYAGTLISTNAKKPFLPNTYTAYTGPAFDNLFYYDLKENYGEEESGVFQLVRETESEGFLPSALADSIPGIFFRIKCPPNLKNPLGLGNSDWFWGKITNFADVAETLDRIVSDHSPIFFRFTI